ncbi:MAG: FAD-dependent oxidoreductase, partial [Thermomicrobiales bacterium]
MTDRPASPSPPTRSSSPHAIVVGAGIAGLIAAHDLGAAGWTVRVLEGSDRIGGRVGTTRTDEGFLL